MSATVDKPKPVAEPPPRPSGEPLLEVRDLKVYFPFRRGNIFRPD